MLERLVARLRKMLCQHPAVSRTLVPIGDFDWEHFRAALFGYVPCAICRRLIDTDNDLFYIRSYGRQTGPERSLRVLCNKCNPN